MKKILAFLFLATLLASCQKTGASRLFDSNCDSDVKASGLSARLAFCELSAPSPGAIMSCMNGTFGRLSSVSPACRVDAAARVIDSSVKLLRYEAEHMTKDSQGNVKSQIASADFSDFVRLSDLYFSLVKQQNVREIHQQGVFAYRAIEEIIFQTIHLLKANNALFQAQGNILNHTLSDLLGLGAELSSTLQTAGNVETILPFALPALTSMVDQLEFYTSISQMFCDLDRCDGNWTQYLDLIQLLATLDTPELFGSAFLARKSDRPVDTVLSLFADRGADLLSLVRDIGVAIPSDIKSITSISVSTRYPTVADTLALVQRFSLLNQKVKQKPLVVSRLRYGLDAESRSAVESRLSAIKSELQTVKFSYENQSAANYQRVLSEIQTHGQTENLKATVEAKQLQLINLIDQTLSAQADLDILEADRYKYVLNYGDLTRTALGDEHSFYKFESEDTLQIAPDKAAETKNWPINVSSQVSVMSALDRAMTLKAGQTMTIQVSGQWSPTCALSKSRYAASLGGVIPKIGPGGFQNTIVDDKAHIESRSVTFASKHSSTNTQTLSQSLGLGGSVGIANAGIGYSGSDSNQNSQESGFVASTTDQNSVNDSASFTGGLRLPGTPFQQYPAGSLLALRIPANPRTGPEDQPIFEDSFAKVDQVVVVNPYTTLMATEDSQFYFIINDCKDTLHGSNDALSLKRSSYSLISTLPAVQKAIKAMDLATGQLEVAGNDIIKEGGSTSTKLAPVISQAKANLENKELKDLPSDQQKLLMDYFQSYVDYAAARIQRKLEIRESALQVKVLNKEIESYQKLIDSNDQQAKLRNLQSINIANNYQLSFVYSKARDLTDFLRFQAIPLLKLYYPKNYRDFLASLNSGTVVTEKLDITTTLAVLDQLADLVKDKLDKDLSLTLSTQRITIAISFPRPGLDTATAGFPKDVPIAGQDISKAFWDMLFKPRNVDAFVRIEPGQLYEGAGQNLFNRFGLSCSMTLPVINNMGLFLYTSSGAINEADMTQVFDVGMQLGPDLLLPTRNGPQVTSLMEPEWGNTAIRAHLVDKAGFNQMEKVLAGDEKLGLISGKGLSPFTSLSVTDGLNLSFDNGLDPLGYPLDIDAITVAFLVDVDKASRAEVNRWISRCTAN